MKIQLHNAELALTKAKAEEATAMKYTKRVCARKMHRRIIKSAPRDSIPIPDQSAGNNSRKP